MKCVKDGLTAQKTDWVKVMIYSESVVQTLEHYVSQQFYTLKSCAVTQNAPIRDLCLICVQLFQAGSCDLVF